MEESPVCGHLQGGTRRHKHTLPSAAAQEANPPGDAQSVKLGRGQYF